jgi:hypothetical protein
MYVSFYSSNTRVNHVALTVTSPYMLLVRVLHQQESDAADARNCAPRNSAHGATETPLRRSPRVHRLRDSRVRIDSSRYPCGLSNGWRWPSKSTDFHRVAPRRAGTKRSAGLLAGGSLLLLRLRPDATSACREVSVSHFRCGELKSRLDTTAAYNQRGAGGSATGGLDRLVTQQAAGGVGAAEAVAGAGWIDDLGGGDRNGLRRVPC